MNISASHPVARQLGALGAVAAMTFAVAACGSDSEADDPAEPASTEAMDDTESTEAMDDTESTDAMDDTGTTEAMDDTESTDAMDDTEDSAPAEGEGGPAAVAIIDFNYDPSPVEVSAGTEITWTNEDSFAHTVTNDGGDLEFDSGNVDESGTFSMAFDEPGEYAYICTIHNQMKSTIVVS